MWMRYKHPIRIPFECPFLALKKGGRVGVFEKFDRVSSNAFIEACMKVTAMRFAFNSNHLLYLLLLHTHTHPVHRCIDCTLVHTHRTLDCPTSHTHTLSLLVLENYALGSRIIASIKPPLEERARCIKPQIGNHHTNEKMLSTLSLVALATVALTSTPSSFVQAKYECDTSLGNYYPYCVNVPDDASSSDKLPTIVFLSGSGARGPASDVKSLVSVLSSLLFLSLSFGSFKRASSASATSHNLAFMLEPTDVQRDAWYGANGLPIEHSARSFFSQNAYTTPSNAFFGRTHYTRFTCVNSWPCDQTPSISSTPHLVLRAL